MEGEGEMMIGKDQKVSRKSNCIQESSVFLCVQLPESYILQCHISVCLLSGAVDSHTYGTFQRTRRLCGCIWLRQLISETIEDTIIKPYWPLTMRRYSHPWLGELPGEREREGEQNTHYTCNTSHTHTHMQ